MGGEAECPFFAADAEKTCSNCGGKHTVWDKRCLYAKKERGVGSPIATFLMMIVR